MSITPANDFLALLLVNNPLVGIVVRGWYRNFGIIPDDVFRNVLVFSMSAPLFGTLRADFPTMSEWFAEEGKMASSGFEGHAAKRQRTDVEGYGVQLGNRVHGYWCNFLSVSLFFVSPNVEFWAI